MLDTLLIQRLFRALNAELKRTGAVGEVGMCGGAVMCLVYEARKSTKDVDGIFRPAREIREAAKKVASRFGVPEDWLNDAAKGFFRGEPPRQEVMNLSHLRVWAPRADYLLAMKCVSARFDSADRDDVITLVGVLGLKDAAEVFKIIEKYYPKRLIPPKAEFFVEEIMEREGRGA